MFLKKIFIILVLFITGTQIVNATFHSWEINELYSNADGSIQFIELFETGSKDDAHQLFSDGAQLTSSDGTTTHMMTFPHDLASGTADKSFLIATSAFAGLAGAVTPDYIMSDGFLFTGGGTVDLFGADTATYSNLPTDGILSFNIGTLNTGINSPTNYLGQTGSIDATAVVPVPPTVLLFGSGLIGLVGIGRRKVRI